MLDSLSQIEKFLNTVFDSYDGGKNSQNLILFKYSITFKA